MRIGIYNHQHLRGGCPICTQTYVQGMIADGMKCMNRAKGIYGEDNEFVIIQIQEITHPRILNVPASED